MAEESTEQQKLLECGTSLVETEFYRESLGSSRSDAAATVDQEQEPSTLQSLRHELLANDNVTTFCSPFHARLPLVYCDQTASNRPVASMEDYLQETCLPFYGNTHTNTSVTGAQT